MDTHSLPLDSRFREVYDLLAPGRIEGLDSLYAPNIRFTDPFHEIEGLPALESYFESMYRNVAVCTFAWGPSGASGDGSFLFQEWTMTLRHRTFRPRETVHIPGCSRLTVVEDRIVAHRDHFDAAALIHDRIPVLGAILRRVRASVGASR